MTWFDYAVLAVLALSAVIGISRGFVREVFALAGWIAATLVAMVFAGEASALIPASFGTPLVRTLIAFAVIFLLVLIGAGFTSLVVTKVVRAAGLGLADRTLGGVFGIARGALILLVLVLVAGLTALPRERFWREAKLSAPLETAATAVKPYLPRTVADRVRYER
jgi:membrane protein required for colicin V production